VFVETAVVIAGFGGQGALFAGKVLTYAAAASGQEVTWIPSYGPEMRGGTAHCTVVIGDEPIGSPLVQRPDYVLALSQPAAEKYASLVKRGGVLIVNNDLVRQPCERTDIRIIGVPASQLAEKAGNPLLANMVLVGTLIEQTGVVTLPAVEEALQHELAERADALLRSNQRALHEGAIYLTTVECVSL
jgi:2-oxoglutarate ferredoxin oxidoreductase subunit gamma